jgi:hypothetical protein
MRTKYAFVGLLIFCSPFVGCADWTRWTRQYTYPPDFRFIEREQLRSAMGQLALHIRELDQHMHAPSEGEQRRQDVLEHLIGMETAAQSLDTSGWPTNHPLIEMNMPKFRRDIRLAREAVERDPPNYVIAASLTGACVYCHSAR